MCSKWRVSKLTVSFLRSVERTKSVSPRNNKMLWKNINAILSLDIIHHIYLLILKDRLHLAPLDNPQRILDLGTGTGIWAIDMAE